MVDRDIPVVAGDIVDSDEQHHVLRVQVYDVRTYAGEQVRSGLTADAAADEIMLGQPVSVEAGPVVGNGISVKHRPGTTGHIAVLLLIVAVARPVFIGILPRLLGIAHNRRPTASGGHFNLNLAIFREGPVFLLEVACGTVGIGAVRKCLQELRPLDERQVQLQLAGVPVGDGAYIPDIPLAAGHRHILTGLALQGDRTVPHRGHSGDELKALRLLHVIGRGVAEHGERCVEDYVFRQLTAAGALRHSFRADEAEISLGGVAHGSLGVVCRAGYHTHEGYAHLVGHQVYLGLPALGVLQAVNALEVHHIGPGPLQACRLEGSVEVDHQMILCGRLCGTAVKVHHRLVVAVHKVHLEAFDAHLGVLLAGALHIAFERQVAGPEYQAHIPLAGVFAERLEVDFRHYLEQVGLLVNRPALVQDHILDAVLGGKVDVVFVGVVVDAGLELYAVHVPGVPPVPGHLAGLHPAEIHIFSGLSAEQPGQVAGQQVLVFPCHHNDTPGELLLGSGLSYIALAALHQPLEHIVATLLYLFGIRGENRLQGAVAVFVGQVHARVVQQVALRDAELHSLRCVEGDGEEGQAAVLPLAEADAAVHRFERGKELTVNIVGPLAAVGHKALAVVAEAECRLLALHREGRLPVSHETVGSAVVVGPEHYTVVLAFEGEFVVRLPNLLLPVNQRPDYAVHTGAYGLLYLDVTAEYRAVFERHGEFGGFQYPHALTGNRPGGLSPGAYLNSEFAGGRLELVLFVCGVKADCGCGNQKEGQYKMFHIYRLFVAT